MQALRVLVAFSIAFSVTILYCKIAFIRDPSSFFFNDKTAYKPIYSRLREQQALDFIKRTGQDALAGAGTDNGSRALHTSSDDISPGRSSRKMCIGIMTILRREKQHFPAAIGSLLDGLTPAERADIHLITFFSDVEPKRHPSYSEPWMEKLVDQVLVRSNSSRQTKIYAKKGKEREKSALDYRHLLHECYSSGTPYITIIEDDIIAAKTWYKRTMQAVRKLDAWPPEEWLFLRLFYSETFLGWNSEEWGLYFPWIVRTMLMTLLILLLAKMLRRVSRSFPRISNWTIAVIMGICAPLSWVLYFLAGRLSMQPLPLGLVRMDNYGCCSQGLVYARDRVPLVLNELDPDFSHGLFPDQRIEALAQRSGLGRWVLVPSVFQHVGRQGATDGVKKTTWNFQFEVIEQ